MTLPRAKPDPTHNDFAAPTSYAVSTGSRYAWAWSNTGVYGRPDGILVPNEEMPAPGVVIGAPPVKLSDIVDGSTQTFMVGEQDYGLRNYRFSPPDPRAGLVRGGNGVWCDGYPTSSSFSAYGPFNEHRYVSPADGPDFRERSGIASFRSEHAAGAHFLYADGAVSFLGENVDRDIYRSLATRAGNELIRNHF
jgi:prepilin-type processing-associated H-X9-DG protein